MKRIALITAIIFLTLALLGVAWQLRAVVLIFVISLVISATFDGPIERFVGMGLRRRWAIILVYLFAVLFLILLLVLIAMPLISETNLFVIDLTTEYNRLRFYISSLTGTRIDLFSTVLPTNEQFSEQIEEGAIAPMLRQAAGITQNVGTIIGQFLLALVLSIYWTVDRTRFERLWLSLLAPDQRAPTRTVLQQLTQHVGAYIRSELSQTILAGGLLTLGFWIIGFKYPFIAAALAALAWLIPLVGGFIALLPVLLIGWMTDYISMGVGVVYTICVLLVMEMLVERRYFRTDRYWGVLVIFVLLALGSEFGIVGLIIAPAVAVALQVIIDALLTPSPSASRRIRVASEDLLSLQERLAQIEAEMDGDDAASTPRLKNLATRVREVLDKSAEAYSSEKLSTESSVAEEPGIGGAVRTTQ